MNVLFDCTRCGACCCNTTQNMAENYPWYVAIDKRGQELVRRKDLRKKYVVTDPEGEPHLRLVDEGRCAALSGKLGRRVSCRVYQHRPSPCRRVQPGDPDCLRAREERGMPESDDGGR